MFRGASQIVEKVAAFTATSSSHSMTELNALKLLLNEEKTLRQRIGHRLSNLKGQNPGEGARIYPH